MLFINCLTINIPTSVVFSEQIFPNYKMTFLETWEEFEKAAERLYLQDPMKVRYSTKYNHSQGCMVMKMTDDVVCLQFKSEAAQDVKKMDKFVNNLMRHMASKEQH